MRRRSVHGWVAAARPLDRCGQHAVSGPFLRDFERAEAALHAAMETALRCAAEGVEVEYKEGGSPVTAADREIDGLLRDALVEPGEGWLSEESVDDGERLTCSRVWVVDPLDGTRSFVSGRKDYSVSIGLLVDRQPVLGAVGSPANGVTVIGGVGSGLQVEGAPAWTMRGERERPRVLMSRSEMKHGDARGLEDRLPVQPVGSVAYKLALVAAGFADATWTTWPKHEWDVAAGAALILAAGGEVWLPKGGHLLWNRPRPRFRSFAGARAGVRPVAERYV
ncbi:MAG: inositol monophosphatase family protein [Planctomycetota bacterium]|nr:inositol monophosphatase family protein [Planctomycetota bacterium]